MKLIGLLSDRAADLALAVPHRVLCADPTDAVIASGQGTAPRPQPHAGVVLAWPRGEAECVAAESELARRVSAHYRAREVLHWDELGAEDAGAVVLTYLVRRRAGLSFAEFEAHYREQHAPLARAHHPGIARYVQNFVESGPVDDARAAIDAISELWFRSEADARTRFYRDAESARVIGEDVRRFIDLRGGAALAVRPLGA